MRRKNKSPYYFEPDVCNPTTCGFVLYSTNGTALMTSNNEYNSKRARDLAMRKLATNLNIPIKD